MASRSGMLPPYQHSLAGTLLSAREAVMAPIRPILREAGVTEQQWRVLRVLADEGACDASRLGGMAMLHAPSVTRIIKELDERRLVVRKSDPADGRRVLVAITAAGKALVATVGGRTRRLLDSYAEAFGAERLATLQGDLAELVLAIGGLTLADTRWSAAAPVRDHPARSPEPSDCERVGDPAPDC